MLNRVRFLIMDGYCRNHYTSCIIRLSNMSIVVARFVVASIITFTKSILYEKRL